MLRSLAISSHLLGVDTVIVMQHTKCGLAGVTDDELRRITGAEFGLQSSARAGALREDIDLLISQPYSQAVKTISGFVYDVESGEIDDVVRWERSAG